MSVPVTVREELLEPLRRVLAWMGSLQDERGRIVCPMHAIEHTGKSAGVIVLAGELLRLDPKRDAGWLAQLIRTQCERLIANLVREGDSACFTFRPGRHDPFNCSNAVIDGGAASDALAYAAREHGALLGADLRARSAIASLLHARTYLRYAVLDKGIPAQRAWGLTGLSAAWTLEHDATLERAALEAVGMLEGIQHGDGSYPYHPLEWGAAHPGAADVSAFYQSRVTGFLMFALESLGRDPRSESFAGPLARGLEFLLALHGPDGIKCAGIEAKPWYWGAEYEVASHPFDVYALASGWRLFGRPRLARAARNAFRAWREHLTDAGVPQSHLAGAGRSASYQCPLFWAAHAGWIARAANDLQALWDRADPPESAPGTIDLSVDWFPDAQLGRLEDAAVVAWVRGARPVYNVHHGSAHGAGLLRVWGKRERRELLTRCPLGGRNEAEWSGLAGHIAPLRGWRAGKNELRFGVWLGRVDWRAGERTRALRRPFDVFGRGVLAFAHPRVSSAFELAPTVVLGGDGITLTGALAHRGGERVLGSRLRREFQIDGAGLSVHEELLDGGPARALEYHVPRAAHAVQRTERELRYRLG